MSSFNKFFKAFFNSKCCLIKHSQYFNIVWLHKSFRIWTSCLDLKAAPGRRQYKALYLTEPGALPVAFKYGLQSNKLQHLRACQKCKSSSSSRDTPAILEIEVRLNNVCTIVSFRWFSYTVLNRNGHQYTHHSHRSWWFFIYKYSIHVETHF